ncbi:MAG: pyridoxal phosphate-dependent aminotransferase [Patescibacteria group bacterium]|jgi:aspartate aminotransferase
MPLKVSNRSQKVIASPIRKFLPLVKAAEKRGLEIFKLNVGDPDLTPPPEFLQTIKNYRQKNIGYAPSPGIPEHAQAWVKYYADLGIKLKPENIIPTVGGAEAILLAMLATADAGDELLVFEPLYTSYKGFAAESGIKLVPVTLKVENNFSLPAEAEIIKKITKKTKAIIVIHPNNPTGTVLTESEIKRVIKIAKKYSLFIIADETYREIVFSGKPSSLLQFPQAKNNLIVVDSASKRFSLPGARIGCIVSYNQEMMWALLKLAMIRLSAPTLEQYGLVPLLRNAKPYTKKITAEYQKRRDVVFSALSKMPGVICQKPNGAFYLIAKLPVKNSEEFIKWLLTEFNYNGKTVLLTPTAEFYITPGQGLNEIRIAYVLNPEKLKAAMLVLEKGLKKYLDSNRDKAGKPKIKSR